ncbi:ATP-binding cassette domain-containing protein [Paenibacillus eucommiae]|uniref:ABC-type multidrug transport system ATPase subunit n=1 Tax=Paenibacillus eucommiae TaxID=1355755 RepID=A0ABS4IQ53_9BACL|nr:ATP-binding cassette domain-containing protein [Paenibacillus eucommiae]MBP1989704.1 ABC-type multidrug transport system ATPase subunit [Paenibacillus eucommiae]
MSMRITLNNVEYTKDHAKLINDTTCTFTAGITYVVGKNGAGKSSLLKLIATAITPDKGSITYTKLIREDRTGLYRKQLSIEDVRTMIGFMPQHFTGHSDMIIERYLTYMAFHKGIPHNLVKITVENGLKQSSLYELKKKKLRALSGGQLQKVGLLQALMNQPRICILDEPFAGLDNQEKLLYKRILHRLSFHSIIMLSTNLLEEIEQSENDSLLYLEDGKVCFYGGVDEVDSILERFKE